MGCQQRTNDNKADLTEFADEWESFWSQQNTPLSESFTHLGKYVDRIATVGDIIQDFSIYNLGKIYAGVIGGAAGGAVGGLLAVEMVIGLGLGSVAFVPGLLIGTAMFAGTFFGSAFYLEKYEEEFGPGALDNATNGSDPADDGCDDSSGLSMYHDGSLISPIVLDMAGDGIELTSLEESHVLFDMDNDNFAEITGWTQPGDDAWLAMDHNANGVIDNQNELFGNTDFFNAFDKLDAYDTNADNQITSADAQFGKFRVWTDANGNGLTDTGELKNLAQSGISSLSLNEIYDGGEIAGHWVYEKSTFIKNGQTQDMKDVFFQIDQGQSAYKLDDSFVYDTEVFKLPQLRGFGDAPDLWVAMTQDATLKGMVKTLTNASYTNFDYTAFSNSVEQMLFRWTETNGIAAGTDWDIYGNAKVEAAAQSWLGVYGKLGILPFFWGANEGQLLDSWHQFVDAVSLRLLVQIPTQPLFAAMSEGAAQYQSLVDSGVPVDTWTDAQWNTQFGSTFGAANTAMNNHPLKYLTGLEYDFISNAVVGDVAAFIDALAAHEPTTPTLKDAYWENWLPLINAVAKGQDYTDAEYDAALSGTWLDVTHSEPVSTLRDGVNLVGTTRANSLVGSNGDDFLMGAPATPTNPNPNDNDTYVGGLGNDLLRDARGNDRYMYNKGDGNDTISDGDGSYDAISLGNGIAVGDITFRQSNYMDFLENEYFIVNFYPRISLLMTMPQDGSITVENGPIESLYFVADGSSKTWAQMEALALAAAQTSSHDFIADTAANETIQGGTGNDVISAVRGNNLIKYNLGDGVDRVYGDFSEINTIRFGANINYADIKALVTPTFVTIIINNNDMLQIMETDSKVPVDFFEFADGTTKTLAQIKTDRIYGDTIQGSGAVIGGAGHDYIVGRYVNNTLSGGLGNDIIEGGSNMTLLGGDGHDYLLARSGSSLDGGNGNDTLQGGGTLKGGAGDDQLYGDSGNENLYGGTGNDFLFGRGGDDTLRGESGNNTVAGGSGNDRFVIAVAGGTTSVIKDFLPYMPSEVIDLSAFGSAVSLTIQQQGPHTILALPNGQSVILEMVSPTKLTLGDFIGVSSIEIQGTAPPASTITGSAGADSLTGTAANEVINGLAGADTLIGGAGNDTLDGGADKDLLTGGAGSDVFKFSSLAHSLDTSATMDRVTDFVKGTDKIDLVGLGFTGLDTDGGTTEIGELRLVFSATSNRTYVRTDQSTFEFYLDGDYSQGANLLTNADFIFTGGSPASTITGSAAADSLTGTAANEVINGLAGIDILVGGAGNDTLDGGSERDTLTGGLGSDVFKFSNVTDSNDSSSSTYMDRVTDFVKGTDRLDLSGLGFTGLDTDGGSTETGELRLAYSSTSNRTYVRSDQSTFEFYLDGDYSQGANLLTNAEFIY